MDPETSDGQEQAVAGADNAPLGGAAEQLAADTEPAGGADGTSAVSAGGDEPGPAVSTDEQVQDGAQDHLTPQEQDAQPEQEQLTEGASSEAAAPAAEEAPAAGDGGFMGDSLEQGHAAADDMSADAPGNAAASGAEQAMDYADRPADATAGVEHAMEYAYEPGHEEAGTEHAMDYAEGEQHQAMTYPVNHHAATSPKHGTSSPGHSKGLTFSGPPYVPKAKPYSRADYSHSNNRLMKIAYDNQKLVQRLTDISRKEPDWAQDRGRTSPSNVASSAVNRRKAATSIAQENHALYQRLVAIKPSKDISRETLEAEHRKNDNYRINCATYKPGSPTPHSPKHHGHGPAE